MKFDLENPTKVKPWFQPDAPLFERNPVLFYKSGFFLLLAHNLNLLFRLLLKGAGQPRLGLEEKNVVVVLPNGLVPLS
jgi:hypothetical protein